MAEQLGVHVSTVSRMLNAPPGAGVRAASVPLTSVRSSMREMGRLSAELLLRLLGGAAVESRRLRPELVVRASTVS